MASPTTYTNTVLRVSNKTSSVLPIAAGIILEGGKTEDYRLKPEQQATVITKLDRLVAAGKVSYQVIPGNDGAATPGFLRSGLRGAVPTGVTRYLDADYTAQAADALGFLVTGGKTLRNFRVHAGTAPGASHTDAYTVLVDGSPCGIAASLAGTAVDVADTVHTFVIPAGVHRVSFKLISDAATAAANMLLSCELV